MGAVPTSYTPRPGSAGDRALTALRARGPMKGADLADEIDVETAHLQAYIVMTLKHDLIRTDRRDDGMWYSLGDGTRPAEHANGSTAGPEPAADGSQKPNGAAAIPRARAGRDAQREPSVPGTPGRYADARAEAAHARVNGCEGKATHAEERVAESARQQDPSEPEGAAGASRRPATVEETTQAGARAAAGAGDDARRDGGPAAPDGRGAFEAAQAVALEHLARLPDQIVDRMSADEQRQWVDLRAVYEMHLARGKLAPGPRRFALCSDGALELRVAAGAFELTPDEAVDLIEYLGLFKSRPGRPVAQQEEVA